MPPRRSCSQESGWLQTRDLAQLKPPLELLVCSWSRSLTTLLGLSRDLSSRIRTLLWLSGSQAAVKLPAGPPQ